MTFNRLVKLRELLSQVRVNTSMSDFDGRLRFQKTVYLLQEMGVKLNYAFGWYHRGPYSREATADGFALSNMEKALSSVGSRGLSETEKDAIRRLNQLVADLNGYFESIEEGLEIVASVDFVRKHGYPSASSKEEVASRLEAGGKPQITESQIDFAMKLLDKHDLN